MYSVGGTQLGVGDTQLGVGGMEVLNVNCMLEVLNGVCSVTHCNVSWV